MTKTSRLDIALRGWFNIGPDIGPETRLAPSAPITALWQPEKSGQYLDLFGATREATVISIWWDASEPAGYRPEGWFTIHPELKTQPFAPVSVSWRDSGIPVILDLAPGYDGHLVFPGLKIWGNNDLWLSWLTG
jgi:hypothetical protein